MSRRRVWWFILLFTVLLFPLVTRAADDDETDAKTEAKNDTNLLRLKVARIERSTAALNDAPGLTAMVDDDLKTVAQATASADAPLDVVFGFEGAIVSAESVVIRLPARPPGEVGAGRVEVLVSTVSPQAGFRSVRSDPLRPTTDPQEFKFRPVGAKWIMLRFTPWKDREEIAVAEALVLGAEGAPATSYSFDQSPAKSLDVLAGLKNLSGVDVSLSPDEKSLVEDAQDGKLDRWSYAEAGLIASGLLSAVNRKAPLAKLAELEAKAKPIVAEGKTPFEKGEKLLKFLHREGILKRYQAPQTDLSTLLETGRYNCVSSALLYAILGRRLGLDVRAIEVPDHAFAVVYDDTRHADVETTTPTGFNPARDAKSVAEFQKLTGFRYIPDKRAQRREIGDAGLVAIVWYNHGVEGTEKKRYGDAIGSYFRALSLDADNASAVKNTFATMHRWSRTLADAGKFQEALTVVGAGLELAPSDAAFLHNREVVWQQWAQSHLEAGRREEALGVLRQAAKAVPSGDFEALQTWVYIKPAEDLASKKDWPAALKIVTPALAQFEGKQKDELVDYQESIYSRWSIEEINAKKWAEAFKILAQGIGDVPASKHLNHNLEVVAQRWVDQVARQEGPAKAETLILDLVKRYPQATGLKDVAEYQLRSKIDADLKAKKYTEALAGVERIALVVNDAGVTEKLNAYAYNAWGLDLADLKKWPEALEVFAKGRAKLPKNETLTKNENVLWHQWTQERLTAEDWPGALKIFVQARVRFADDEGLEQNEKYSWSKLGTAHYDKKDFVGAVKVFADARKRFPDDKNFEQNELGSWFGQCDVAIKAEDWEKAVELHQQALVRFPKEANLKENERICWLNWSKVHADKKEWEAAVKVLEKAAKRFPEDDDVLEHLKISRENADK